MKKKIAFEKIFTPQGLLGNVMKNPDMDFLMNIFQIPRIYSVSGFGEWNVGQHTVATAFLGLYWASFNKYSPEKRDRLVTLALVHDAHEAVIGDILPFFKTAEVREAVNRIQKSILDSFSIDEDATLKKDLKLIDMIAFLYEISQSSPRGMTLAKRKLLKEIYKRQKEMIYMYCEENTFSKQKITTFLKRMKLY